MSIVKSTLERYLTGTFEQPDVRMLQSLVLEVQKDLGVNIVGHFPIEGIIGGPAAGKGTIVSEYLNQPHSFLGGHVAHLEFSKHIGEYKKKHEHDMPDVVARITQAQNSGNLVSDHDCKQVFLEITYPILKKALDGKHIPILDGFPRNTTQAKFATEYDALPDRFTYIYCPDETYMQRMLLRNVRLILADKPPRADAMSLEIMRTRLKAFHTQTHGLIEYIPSGVIDKVDGTLVPAAVYLTIGALRVQRKAEEVLHHPQYELITKLNRQELEFGLARSLRAKYPQLSGEPKKNLDLMFDLYSSIKAK